MAKKQQKSQKTIVKVVKHNRHAGNGQYVTSEFAKNNPGITVTEHDKIEIKKPLKKG